MRTRLATGIAAVLIGAALFAPTKSVTAQTLSHCGYTHGFACGTAHVTICALPGWAYCLIEIERDITLYQSWIYES